MNVVEGNGDKQIVDVVATEMSVAIGGDDFEDAVVKLKDRNVEGATAKVVDGNNAILFLVETVGQGGGRWLVYEAKHIQTGDASGIFCGLPLSVVEVRRHRDD